MTNRAPACRAARTASGSEIYVSHRGAEEVYVGETRESTTWRARPNDPDLEVAQIEFGHWAEGDMG
jgi:outer membrane protein assembly factor BamC